MESLYKMYFFLDEMLNGKDDFERVYIQLGIYQRPSMYHNPESVAAIIRSLSIAAVVRLCGQMKQAAGQFSHV